MKNVNHQPLFKILMVLVLGCLLLSCKEEQKTLGSHHHMDMTQMPQVEKVNLPAHGNLVEVKTTGMNFILPDTIPSGWTSFRYTNSSSWAHFMLLDKLPEVEGKQITYADFGDIPPIFVDAMDLINSGKQEEGFAEFGRLPAWFSQIIFSGGVGIITPGETAQTTVYVKPGTYVIECYIKTNGKFHPMSRQLIVQESGQYEESPVSTLDLKISSKGIEMTKEPTAGLHTIAVHYQDQAPHEHFLGHDVHLVKLESEKDVETLNGWMNWAEKDGLNTPAPVRFLGGAQEMPAGNTAYITVDFKPGIYAWVSEVPNPASKNMLKTFTVAPNLGSN
jgi:hypothetical protein